jgi:hypothetical protein
MSGVTRRRAPKRRWAPSSGNAACVTTLVRGVSLAVSAAEKGEGRSAEGGSGTSAGESDAVTAATGFVQRASERALQSLQPQLAENRLRFKGQLREVVLRVLEKARLDVALKSATSISAGVRTNVGPAPAGDRAALTGPGVT